MQNFHCPSPAHNCCGMLTEKNGGFGVLSVLDFLFVFTVLGTTNCLEKATEGDREESEHKPDILPAAWIRGKLSFCFLFFNKSEEYVLQFPTGHIKVKQPGNCKLTGCCRQVLTQE